MADTANSKISPGSEGAPRSGWLPVAAALVLLAGISGVAVWFSWRQGWLLSYGDAEAHLNIARRLLDSRTPGPEQLGTVWLPLPHLLMLPLAASDALWRSGLAGAIPSALGFILAGVLLFAAARRQFSSDGAGSVAAGLLALNPNLLYLATTPMTEPLFLAAFMALLYFCVLFRQSQSPWAAAAAGGAALAGSLTRYEGWFLIPFAVVFFLLAARRNRLAAVALFGMVALAGPAAWLAHDRYYYGDWLAFYRGPYSAKAIQGRLPYPGQDDWRMALVQFGWAARHCAGLPLTVIGATGALVAVARRAVWPVLLLALPGLFYVWSIHSAGTPIFVPDLWPHSYYNARYGLVLLPLLAFGGAALWPARLGSRWLHAAIVLVALSPWLQRPEPDGWIAWKEAQVNSRARRAWTEAAAAFLRDNYRAGEGVFTSFGDTTGIFRLAGIPLRETLTGDNGPHWEAAILRPDLVLWEQWAVAQGGDPVQAAIDRARRRGLNYELAATLRVKGAPVIEIYRRRAFPNPYEHSISQSARSQERFPVDLER